MSADRVDRYLKILAAAPDNHLARFGLANARFEEGRFDLAAEEYRRCLLSQPDWMAVQISLGHCLVRLGLKAEAREALERARRLAIAQGHSGPQEEIAQLLSKID
jgi:Flp pilus assembly protein TadD